MSTLSPRTAKLLGPLKFVRDLARLTEKQFLKGRGIGPKTLTEIRQQMHPDEIPFGLIHESWRASQW